MRTRRYEYQGQALTIRQLLALSTNSITRRGLHERLDRGMSAEAAITEPVLTNQAAARLNGQAFRFSRRRT